MKNKEIKLIKYNKILNYLITNQKPQEYISKF